MHATTHVPVLLPQKFVHYVTDGGHAFAQSLVRMDQVVEFIGDDPDTQRQVFNLCLSLIITSLPQLRRAMKNGDLASLRRIAHHTRGSLGLLGVPHLQALGEEIEYRCDELGAERRRQRCQQLCEMLEHLQLELEARLAA